MNYVAPAALISLSALVVALSYCAPHLLSKNSFLQNFINHEIVNILAVIMTITITTVATIHIWFNELEAKHEKKVFGAARRDINSSALHLVWLFVGEIVLLIVRGQFTSDPAMSLFNGFALLILLGAVLVLIDIIGVIRALTPAD